MRVALVLLAVLLPGCALVPEPGPREVEGPTTGYAPTATYLKVYVREADGNTTWASFDRRDWHVSEIARRIDGKTLDYLAVRGMERSTFIEVVVEEVREPEELESLRYDAMRASAEERAAMDLAYEELLRAHAAAAAGAPAPGTPTLPSL